MQVVAGGIPSGADITDYLALLHFLPYSHTDRGTMGIQGIEGIVVVYFDVVPIPAAPRVNGVGNGDGTIRCRKNGRTARSADIGSCLLYTSDAADEL